MGYFGLFLCICRWKKERRKEKEKKEERKKEREREIKKYIYTQRREGKKKLATKKININLKEHIKESSWV